MVVDFAKYISEYFSFLESEDCNREWVKSLGRNFLCGKPFMVELRNSLLCSLQSPGLRVSSVDEFSSRLLALATPPESELFDFDNSFEKMTSSYIRWVTDYNVTEEEFERGLTSVYTINGILFNTDDYYADKLPEMNKSARTKLIKRVQVLAKDCMDDMYEQWRDNGDELARRYEMQPKKGILKGVSVLSQPSSPQTSDNSDSNSASSRSRGSSQSSLSSGD